MVPRESVVRNTALVGAQSIEGDRFGSVIISQSLSHSVVDEAGGGHIASYFVDGHPRHIVSVPG